MARKRAEDAHYRIIYRTLKEEILSQNYLPGKLLPAERELGERFKVDRITVRKGLQLLVDDGLVEKRAGIGTFVKDLNEFYTPNTASSNILYILPKTKSFEQRMADIFGGEMYFYLQEEFMQKGYNLLYTFADDSSSFNTVSNNNFYCGAVFASYLPTQLLEECKYTKTPAIIINNVSPELPSIIPDNIGGARIAVETFVKNGHKRIGMICGGSDSYNTAERMKGFTAAMNEFGVKIDYDLIVDGDWTFEGGKAAMEKLMSLPELPTAVFASNDISAIGAITYAKEHGLHIPNDISFIGFDNITHSKFCDPTLTSVDINFKLLARAICANLIDIIVEGGGLNYKISVPVRLEERFSVKNLKAIQ